MRNSNTYFQREYYNDVSHSRVSSQTSRKLKSLTHRDDVSDTKTRFLTRIEKACTTMSTRDVSKELGLYRKEIERLQKQLLKKDKVILEIRSTTALNKQLEVELVETYRIIYMYEGKINQYQKELKRLEQTIAKANSPDIAKKVEELLQSYRTENGEMMGRMEESNRIIFQLQERLKKVESKYFSTAWRLSSTKRQITNPLKKRFPNLRNTITIKQTPLLLKEKALKMSAKNEANPSFDQYQINQNRTTKVQVQKEPIHFKRYQSKPESPKTNYYQSSQKNIKNGQFTALSNSNDQSTKMNDHSVRRESVITEQKVYASPINRYELNKKVEEVSNMMDAANKRYSQSNSFSFQAKNIRL